MSRKRTDKKRGKTEERKTAGKMAGVLLGTALLAGCSAIPPTADGQGSRGGDGTGTYISVEDAKETALENAGLSPEQVRFVRFGLDTGADGARYEMEFISEDAGYDYGIDAVTGEILSMSCEAGSYKLADVDTGMVPEGSGGGGGQAADSGNQTGKEQQNGIATEPGQAGNQASPADNSSGGAGDGLPEEGNQYIGRNRAQQIALEHANFTEEDVRFVHSRLEFDDGIWLYDVEFRKDQAEYDYEIDAVTGEILQFDQDAEYYQNTTASSGNTGQMLTEEEAVKLALAHAGVDRKDAQSLQVELDYDDGRSEYEVEWDVGRTEYSCDVDAYSGQILSFEKELD